MIHTQNNTMTMIFPDEKIAKLFQAWMSDGGGEQYFYDVAADGAGVYLDFDYTSADRTCLVTIVGLVVDDDDPEVHGIFENDE